MRIQRIDRLFFSGKKKPLQKVKYLDEYDGIEEDADWSDGNESDKLSDFEENVDVIREMHLDDEMNEIYVERVTCQCNANGKIF